MTKREIYCKSYGYCSAAGAIRSGARSYGYSSRCRKPVKRLLREVSSMKEAIGAQRYENTAMKAEIQRLRNPVGISPRTSTATAEVNVTEELN